MGRPRSPCISRTSDDPWHFTCQALYCVMGTRVKRSESKCLKKEITKGMLSITCGHTAVGGWLQGRQDAGGPRWGTEGTAGRVLAEK